MNIILGLVIHQVSPQNLMLYNNGTVVAISPMKNTSDIPKINIAYRISPRSQDAFGVRANSWARPILDTYVMR